MEDLIYKNMSEISDMSVEGIIVGYANVYNVKDLQGDISAFGSFAKTVSERQNKIKIFKNHNDSQLVGIPAESLPESFILHVEDEPVAFHSNLQPFKQLFAPFSGDFGCR